MKKGKKCICEEVYEGLGILLDQKCPVHGNSPERKLKSRKDKNL